MRLRVGALLAVVLLMAGCAASPEPESPATTESKPPVTSEPVEVAPAPEPTEEVIVDDSADRKNAFLIALTAIDPGLTQNADRALGRAENICLDIESGKDEATILANAEARYEGGFVPDLTPEQAQLIVDAARENVC